MIEQLENLARGAGNLLLRYYGSLSRGDAQHKGGRRRDLVSQADIEAEAYILKQIPAADDVLAEEGGSREGTGDRLWIVDPLDGTVNFLHGIPFWCVSIAVYERHEPVAAVVHAPALAQTFTASAGSPMLLNGSPAEVSSTAELDDSILATGFAYNRNALADNNLDNVVSLGLAAAGLRRFGSAALDLAYTACGRLDGYWELHLEPWDVAAGIQLVRAGGGTVTDFAGGVGGCGDSNLLHGRNIVASNGRVHEALRGRLEPLRGL